MLFRLFVRVKAFRRLYWDDFLVILAWIFFLASAVIWQTQKSGTYSQFGLASGTLAPTPAVLSAFLDSQRGQLAVLFMFYSCLWAIKLSFLIFFRRLGQKVRGQKTWWWCVTGLVIVTYITCIGTIQYPCLLGTLEYIMSMPAPPLRGVDADSSQPNVAVQVPLLSRLIPFTICWPLI